MKHITPILIIIIILLVGSVGYLVGRTNKPNVTSSSPTTSTILPSSTTPVACTMEAKLCPDGSSVGRTGPKCEFSPCPEIKIVKITGGGVLSFPKYELSVPSSWTSKRTSQTKDDEKLELSNGTYKISIQQGGFGGSACLYPGDPSSQGPAGNFTSFVELTTKSGDKLRRSGLDNGKGFGVCQLTQYGWGAPTLYGHISLTVPISPTPEELTILDNILSSLTKI